MDFMELKQGVEEGNLFADPREPGEFADKNRCYNDGIGFLNPNNWVFHDQIVKNVLSGDYFKIMPVCSEIDATLNCSNRCTECAYKYVKIPEGVWLRNDFSDPEVHMPNIGYAINIVDNLKRADIKGIIFTGGGEPFLFKGLEEVVNYTTSLGIDSVCYTNGNILEERRINRILEAQPLLVRVSLNAGTKEVYDSFHKPLVANAFERTLKTIKRFAIGSLNSKTSVGVGVVINEENQNDLVNAALRVREIIEAGGKIEFIAYRPQFDYYMANQLPNELLDRTYEIVERDVKALMKGTGVKVANLGRRYEALKRDTKNYSVCRASGICAEVGPLGAFFCCDRNLNRKYFIGKMNTELKEVYSGDERRRILEYVDESKCKVCPPACKSHEANIQFQKIEELREQGKIERVELWINAQRKIPKPKMVNFP